MNDTSGHDTSPVAHQQFLTPIVDPVTFDEFVALLGPSKAQFWLQELRTELIASLGPATEQNQDTLPSRDEIHHLYGRAGFMGFNAFREACGHCLELGPDDDGMDAAYQRLRIEAERACAEIERQANAQA